MNADPKIEFAAILNLTAREYEIFQALGQGMTTRQIADLVGHRVERTTISSLQETIARKVGARDWRALFRMAVQYDYTGLKRAPLVPSPPQYKFVEPNELDEAAIQALPASRNGHSLLANRLNPTKG